MHENLLQLAAMMRLIAHIAPGNIHLLEVAETLEHLADDDKLAEAVEALADSHTASAIVGFVRDHLIDKAAE